MNNTGQRGDVPPDLRFVERPHPPINLRNSLCVNADRRTIRRSWNQVFPNSLDIDAARLSSLSQSSSQRNPCVRMGAETAVHHGETLKRLISHGNMDCGYSDIRSDVMHHGLQPRPVKEFQCRFIVEFERLKYFEVVF